MRTRERILTFVKMHGQVQTPTLVKALKISRQAVAGYLRSLVDEGLITKEGSTRGATYFWGKGQKKLQGPEKLRMLKSLKGLEEDRVFNEIERWTELKLRLSENAEHIVFYAFTEMLNNAIDHSGARLAEIQFWVANGTCHFVVRDKGVGIFKKVRQGFQLKDELGAVDLLLKGKHTTSPERHSGQGIFFTSKIADVFRIRSHKISLNIDNAQENLVLGEQRFFQGTEVSFSIKTKTRKSLRDLFEKYSEREFAFDKNILRLGQTMRSPLVSRSQARRIVLGLEKFESIVFDFERVKEIGQAFADEIFRVFADRHPDMKLTYINTSPIVEKMIARAIANRV